MLKYCVMAALATLLLTSNALALSRWCMVSDYPDRIDEPTRYHMCQQWWSLGEDGQCMAAEKQANDIAGTWNDAQQGLCAKIMDQQSRVACIQELRQVIDHVHRINRNKNEICTDQEWNE